MTTHYLHQLIGINIKSDCVASLLRVKDNDIFILISASIHMPSMRAYYEKQFRERYDRDNNGKLNQVSLISSRMSKLLVNE